MGFNVEGIFGSCGLFVSRVFEHVFIFGNTVLYSTYVGFETFFPPSFVDVRQFVGEGRAVGETAWCSKARMLNYSFLGS